ncbi:MAG: hypothetical protein IJ652_06785 [Bacteroidales bacterium]|nr:hypothetical protein [Bacteroidales bacterium]
MVKKWIYSLFALVVLGACQSLVQPKDDDACDLRALTVRVHYDAADPSLTEDFDAMSGGVDAETGEATFSFPRDAERYNAETLSRCTLEAVIPSTASLVVYDADGAVREGGLGGVWNLANGSVVFDVVAANGARKHYDFLFRMRR